MTNGGSTAISRREAEVLDALSDHLSNAEIGQRLHISIRTVESHVSSLLRKLGATDRRDLTSRAAHHLVAGSGPSTDPTEHATRIVGLPGTWTTFVGRSNELAALSRAISSNRLVTIVGPGGVGKTRLAIVAATHAIPAFPAGGAFVDLVPATPEFVVHGAAAVLGVVERPQLSLERVVQERLGADRTLLVLDNCEHVLEAAANFIRGILTSCPQTVIVATSRERLGVPGERVVTLPPLSLIATGDGGEDSEATLLFTERAGAVNAAPGVIGEICRRLDGVPLAIELAAARSSSLGLDGLLAGLENHLRLLSRANAVRDRHGSLRTVIDWSHQLLDDDERTTFRRLGVFVGAFDLASAGAVAASSDMAAVSDMIGRLTDKSLLVHVPHESGSRWRMLETVHIYAHEQLEASGEADEVRRHHQLWATATARELEQSLDGQGWQERFDAVAGDLRSALLAPPSLSTDNAPHELALALAHLTYARRFLLEARDHYQSAIERAPDTRSAVVALRMAAGASFAEMRGDAAFDLLKMAFAQAVEMGDNRIAATVLADAAALAGRCPALFVTPLTSREIVTLIEQAQALAVAGDLEVATHIAVASAWDGSRGPTSPTQADAVEAVVLAREFGDPELISSALDAAASAAACDGHFKRASRLTSERLPLLQSLPRHDPRVGGERVDIFHMAAESAVGAGELSSAVAHARNSYNDDTIRGLPHFAAAYLITPLVLKGEFGEALEQAIVMRRGWEQAGRPAAGWMSPSFYATAFIHGVRGDEDNYAKWRELGSSIQLIPGATSCSTFFLCRVALHTGAIEHARPLAETPTPPANNFYEPYACAVRVEIAVVAGAADAEDRLIGAAHMAQENDFASAQLLRAAGRLRHDETALKEAVIAWEAIGARFERACTLMLIRGRADEGAAELAELGCPLPAAL